MKSFLKKILPRILLKKLFLYYNTLRIKTIDRVLFPALEIPSERFFIKHEKNPFLELNIPIDRYHEEVQSRLRIWTDPTWTQDEYLLVFDDGGYIEPLIGWGISTNRELIYPSLGFSHASYVKKPAFWEYYSKRRSTCLIDQVISLRDTGEENYFHFFNDVLPKIFFLLEQGIPVHEYTLVVSERLYNKSYFQFFYNTWANTFTWHVQKDEWIQFRRAIFCKPYTHAKKFLMKGLDVVHYDGIKKVPDRRIFLSRSRKSLRYIENEDEIFKVVARYGFEKVDTAELPFLKQVALFSETSHLIAIHGAGLANILFGSKMSILEIYHTSEYVPFHYIMLASLLGFDHQILLGTPQDANGGFRVEAAAVVSYLREVKMSTI